MARNRDRWRLRRGLAIVASVCATSLAAGQPCDAVVFPARAQFDVGDFSTGIDAADFDGDGDLDLVTANRNSADVSVILNRGGGWFMAPVHYPVGLSPRYVVAADFDGDGDVDLATCDRDDDTVTVLLNAGDATFALHVKIPAINPDWLEAGDLDGDGDQDLLVTLAINSGTLLVLANDGAASFVETGDWEIGLQPRGGEVADLDNDGVLDVVICNLLSEDLSILLGAGDGSFHTVSTVPAGLGPRHATAADFDGDGDVDLGVVHKLGDDLWVFRNDGFGNFVSPESDRYPLHHVPHGVASADLDHDGDVEIVACSINGEFVDVFLNDGAGLFTRLSIAAPYGEADVIAVDVGGDPGPDIVVANKNDMVSVYLNETPRDDLRRVIYVDDDARPGGDGRSWATAFDDLDAALEIPVSRADGKRTDIEIWIAAGRYSPRGNTAGDEEHVDRAASFRIPAGVSLLGHFAGHECDPSQRDLLDPACTTVLSGDLAGDDQVPFAGYEENVHLVVNADLRSEAPPRPETVFDGFTVSAGNASRGGAAAAGMDIIVPVGHTLTIRNCRIIGNTSAGDGAGVRVRGDGEPAGLVRIVNSVISGNVADGQGGGLAVEPGGVLDLRACTISSNLGSTGGGMRVHAGTWSVTVTDCSFTDNVAQIGGALWLQGGPEQLRITVSESAFRSNHADSGGAIVMQDSSSSTVIRNCTIVENAAAGSLGTGGGVLVSNGSPTIVDCLLYGNIVDGPLAMGAGIYATSGSPVVANCTFAGNLATIGGGLFNAGGGVPDVGNCIFWSNTGGEIAGQVGAETHVTRSVVQNGWDGPGGGNLDVDPLFHDPAQGDHRIGSGSPCIDYGANDVVLGLVTHDLDGNSRFLDDPGTVDSGLPSGSLPVVDLGAFEFACAADIDRSGDVEFNDFLLVLSAWGPCEGFCPEDLDGNGAVGFIDMVMILAAWGPCN